MISGSSESNNNMELQVRDDDYSNTLHVTNSAQLNNTQVNSTSRIYRFFRRIFSTRPIDTRRTVISIIIRYKLRLLSLRVIIFTILTIFSNIIEINKTCKPDIKLWLNVIVGRSIVKMILHYFIYGVVNGIINNSFCDYTVLYKLSEMNDVFGMVWFAVGNLLLFNGMSCRFFIPFSFYTTFSYIVVSYLSVVIPIVLRISLSLSPANRDNQNEIYQQFILIRNRNNTNHDLENDLVYNFVSNNPSFNNELNNTQNEFWRSWLQERNCLENKYIDIITKQNKVYNINDEAFCPICLLEFDDNDNDNYSHAVEYPGCLHIFHSLCLHQWLHASGIKGSRNLSCPCCRST